MTAWVINSDSALQSFIGDIRQLFSANKFVRVSAKIGKARSIPQNSIGHIWYDQIARELREDDATGWKAYCKLHHGVQILRAEDEEYRKVYDATIKGMTYEDKLLVMRFFPCTSRMSKDQKTRYLESVQSDFRKRGVILEFPKE